jgi:hypothetical protein
MSAALITAAVLSVGGLALTTWLGYSGGGDTDLLRHATLGIFVTLLTLLTHSMMMFYLLGKGRAIREAVTEGGLSQQFVADVARARRPVFSLGTLASAIIMAAAIIGAGVDTRVIPAGVHGVIALSALVLNLMAVRAEFAALGTSSRIVAEVNRLLGA